MAATAQVAATNAAAEQGTAGPTPATAPKAPAKAAPKLAAAPEATDDAESKPEPAKPKPERSAPADTREANVAKFAKAMNAAAEKDGVAVDAPPEERRAKPGPKPGSKREKPEPAKPAPSKALAADDTDAGDDAPGAEDAPAAADSAAEVDEDADTGKPEPRATHQLKAKARLRHGDVDKAIKIAFGDLRPEEFDATKEALAKKLGVGSKQWADFRRYTAAETAKSKQLEANAVQLSQRLQADFQPLIDARKAFAAKDYPTAFKLAFGEDINDFSRKAIHQKLSQDPEKTRLQQRLDELESLVKRGGAPAEQQQATPEQQQNEAMEREGARTHKALTEQTDDPEIAHFAKKRAFVARVVEIRGEHYDPTSHTTISMREAAEMARDELKRAMDEWRYEEASGAAAPSSASPGLAGNEPVRTSTRARSPNPSLAAQAGGSTRSFSRQERIAAYAARMT